VRVRRSRPARRSSTERRRPDSSIVAAQSHVDPRRFSAIVSDRVIVIVAVSENESDCGCDYGCDDDELESENASATGDHR
jgi:hypothetical protein